MYIIFRFAFILVLFAFIFSTEMISQSASELVQEGMTKYQNGDYEGALNSFNAALQNSSLETGESLTNESEESDVSVSDETDAGVSAEQDAETSQEEYAEVSQEETVTVQTEKYVSDPLEYQGDDPGMIYLYLGRANMQLGNTEDALNDFDQAVQLDPSLSDAYFRRALINYNINPATACPDLQTAMDQGHQSAKELFDMICK